MLLVKLLTPVQAQAKQFAIKEFVLQGSPSVQTRRCEVLFLQDHYLLIKALHIISVISWMAGMLYLPRLFVYHAGVAAGSEASELFKVMERRLLRFIINPAMIFTFITGGMLYSIPGVAVGGWFHMKFTLIIILSAVHGFFARWRKQFEKDQNTKSQKFFRIINEVPTVIMIAVVLLAVTKPF